ncbi:hypothetical protein [Polyangium sp. 6x1]|uniref:hypothetical protein n=1 Tax=Polyangium sp. 6x1 TaxID=3042689 RepID=UPI0024826A13|nr:hypothetical protein [Polyangium sp. 6x1]MDI1451310.1 hypothetical protein [Polyangium sp. 6x1]
MIDIILQVGALSAPAARDLLAALRERFRRGGREFWRSRAYALGTDTPGPVPPEWARYGGARPELRGAPRNTILAVKGLEKMTPAFRARLLDLCEALGIPVDSMAAIMSSESGFDSKALNPLPAAGLIQLTVGAHLPGFGTKEAILAVLKLSPEQQLEAVVAPLYARMPRAKRATPGHLYMMNFLPDEAGKPEEHQIGILGETKPDGKPTFRAKVYEHNTGFDQAKKGFITVGDVYAMAAAKVRGARGRRMTVDGAILEPSGAVVSASPEVTPPAKVPEAEPPPKAVEAAPPAKAPAPAPASPRRAGRGTPADPIAWDADVGGLLVALAEQDRVELPAWVPVQIGDLVVEVSADALRAQVAYLDESGKLVEAALRVPCSYGDQITLARRLGAISFWPALWEATFRAAQLKVVPEPLPAGPRMASLGYSVRHNRNLEKYNPAPGVLIRDVGKGWVLSPRLDVLGAVNYGWIQPNGRAIQTEGARHNPAHIDYSQLPVFVRRYARDSKGETVDLLEYLQGQGIAKRWLDVYQ